MKRPPAYTPATVLAGGIAHLGDAMPPPLMQPTKPTQHNKIMPKPAQPGRPAKPAKAKAPTKDEDYSTPYQAPVFPLAPKHQPARADAAVPPVAPPSVKDCLTVAPPASVPGLDDIQIDNGVPLPSLGCGSKKITMMAVLLGRLGPGQSARLGLDYKSSLQKAMWAAHKAQAGLRFSIRLKHDDALTLRVWRVA